jgi:hypothetical protein
MSQIAASSELIARSCSQSLRRRWSKLQSLRLTAESDELNGSHDGV